MTMQGRRRVHLALWLFAALLAAGFAGLGAWQYGRGTQKEAMLARSADVLARREPVALAVGAGEPGAGLTWAAGRGRFLDTPAVLLDNQLRDGAGGVRAYRAFMPDDSATAVLVDLGWFALPQRATPPAVPAPAGTLELAGLLAPPPSAGIAMGPPFQRLDDGTLLALRMELPALAEALGVPLASRVLRLDPERQVPGLATGVRDLVLFANTLPPERHRGYALQWFALAAATVIAALLLGLRRGHQR